MVMSKGLDQQKLKVFEAWNKNSTINDYIKSVIWFDICGLKIELLVGHFKSTETFQSLTDHYSKFSCAPAKNADIKISYYECKGDLQNYLHPFWRGEDPSWNISTEGNDIKISQRSFVAQSNLQFNEVLALGPEITADCFDSIDNIVTLLMSKHLPLKKALIVHAATVIIDNKAHVFYGDSGAGKSTLALRSIEKLRFPVLSSDQIYLMQTSSGVMAIPAPTTIPEISSNNPLLEKKIYPVESLIHLTKELKSVAQAYDPVSALPMFLRQIFYQKEFSEPSKILNLACDILDSVSVLGNISYNLQDGYIRELNHIKGYN